MEISKSVFLHFEYKPKISEKSIAALFGFSVRFRNEC